MGTDKKLVQSILKAGETSGERVWELPLWDDYCDDVKSKIADVKISVLPARPAPLPVAPS